MRRFGGVGLMIAQPAWRVRVVASSSWSACGPLAERALSFAERFTRATRQEEANLDLSPRRVEVVEAAPEHAGLGSGTQVGLAVARALAASWGLNYDLPTLAHRVGRGLRSALGAHGFAHGGLLVEAGKRSADALAPLAIRLAFPEAWRLVLILSAKQEGVAGMHGRRETEVFARLAHLPASAERTDVLCRVVLLGLLPALAEENAKAFGEALHEFNVRAGEAFAPVQGGVYAGARVAEIVSFVRGQGVSGAGQSSWGPTVFAVTAGADQAEHLAASLRKRFALGDADVWVTPACNHGATVESFGEQPESAG